ncbi:single-stranded DNA-binding protein [bacterium]|nr:MAG: single-stranded DNA-binding protein [bacterium]QQR61675.1 MAG: single-stranded DNA-binding protein [bacterium]
MASYNRIVLVGNLTRDPEHKQITSGQSVCRLSLATNRQFKNRQNNSMVQEVCYIDVDVWGAQAESCKQYLQKGRSVLVEGRLKLDTWQDQTGSSRSKHSVVADRVVFLGNGAATADTEAEMVDEEVPAAPQSLRGGDLQLNPNNKVEKDLMDQLAKAEKKVKAARTATQKSSASDLSEALSSVFGDASTGELDFKDQPPFEDDLPF